MATLLIERAVSSHQDDPDLDPCATDETLGGRRGVHGRFTLDELIVGVWEDLAVRALARCPICSAPMERKELEPGKQIGRCRGCGTILS